MDRSTPAIAQPTPMAPVVVVAAADAAPLAVPPGEGAGRRQVAGRPAWQGWRAWPLLEVVLGGAALWGLYVAALALAAWAGHEVLAPGGWIAADRAVYRALNGVDVLPLTAALFTLLNEPGPDYFALILVLLAYCGWRRRAALPAAALAIGVALALGQVATRPIEHAGSRERPFVGIAEARTPIASCQGSQFLTWRGRDGPLATCDGSPAQVVGQDWREIWTRFPSFPSGHLRETAALAVLLAYFWPASWPFALAYTLVMAFSRVHLGAHFPSDVLGGALIGVWSGGLTALGLAVLRRALRLLHGVGPLGAAWDWVFVTRVPSHPEWDPLAARLIRIACRIAVAPAMLYGLGFASTTPKAGQVYNVLQNVDYFALGHLTASFNSAAAPALYLLLGPAGVVYVALAAGALGLAWIEGRRRGHPWPPLAATALASASAVALALALSWAGGQWFHRTPPVVQVKDLPVPAAWHWAVAGSFPSAHALLVAALAGVCAGAARRAAAPAQLVALAAALAAVYFGAAWLTDALAGYVAGSVAGSAARYLAAQFIFVPGMTGAPAAPEAPGRAVPSVPSGVAAGSAEA